MLEYYYFYKKLFFLRCFFPFFTGSFPVRFLVTYGLYIQSIPRFSGVR